MKTFDFPPLTQAVVLKFTCPTCEDEVVTEPLTVPAANYGGDNHEESLVTEEYEVECPICGVTFNITVGESNFGGEGWIDELDEDTEVEVIATPVEE